MAMKEQGQPQTAALVVEHAAFVFRVLTHLGVPSSHVEDASQEVFLIVLRQLDGFKDARRARPGCSTFAATWRAHFRRRERGKLEVATEELPAPAKPKLRSPASKQRTPRRPTADSFGASVRALRPAKNDPKIDWHLGCNARSR